MVAAQCKRNLVSVNFGEQEINASLPTVVLVQEILPQKCYQDHLVNTGIRTYLKYFSMHITCIKYRF